MTDIIKTLLPYGVLASHVVFVVTLVAILSRKTWGGKITNLLGKHSIEFGFVVSTLAVLGSLFYSQVLGYEPCILCWWQRVLLFPMPVLFLIALIKKNRSVFDFVLPLAIIAGVIALYQSYTSLGGSSILPCTAVGGACSKVYVKEFGYITIPMMSLTISAYMLLIAWAKKVYNENSNA